MAKSLRDELIGKEYIVYFEIFDKKLKATVFAGNEGAAKEVVKSRIKFHKIEEAKTDFNNIMDSFSEMFKK